MKKPEILSDEKIDYQIEYVLKNNNLPLAVVLKPLCQSIAQAQAELSVREVVEWIQAHNDFVRLKICCSKHGVLLSEKEWQAQLEEWGLS